MRIALPLLLLLAPAGLAAEVDLPPDIAAAHPEGKWKIRKADLYRYLVRYYAGQPSAVSVLPEYMKLRLVESEAAQRGLSVTEAEVERWLEALSARMVEEGGVGLDEMRREMDMRKEELRRRGRQWLLYEKVARAIVNEKDSTRDRAQPLSDDTVILVIDTLYQEAAKQTEDLPEGVVARIRGIDITEYEYGRALSYDLPVTEVYKALRGLILFEEAALLVGDRAPPSKAELRKQQDWYIDFEKNRLARMPNAPKRISLDMVKQVLEQRGLTLDLVWENPAFQAQARALGHFERELTEKEVRAYYEENQEKYGDQLQVARILIGARGQEVPGVGRKIRTLQQGKAAAEELWHRLEGGQDFSDVAREHSEDPDVIRLNGGVVPFWITADRPDYKDTYAQAAKLSVGGISEPFFSQGRGFVIVKLLGRKEARSFEELRGEIRDDLARRHYHVWRNRVTRAAHVSAKLLEKD